MNHLPIVALIGRANVGKSSLFNRLSESRAALISPEPGTTRDINQKEVVWRGRTFLLWDTAGLDNEKSDVIGAQATVHAKRAFTKASVICFMLDGMTGINPADFAIAKLLYPFKKKRPLMVVANKVDRIVERKGDNVATMRTLGLGEVLCISAKNGKGIGELLDRIVEALPPEIETTTPEKRAIKIAIIGKPNVGKSSLLNAILGFERSVVSDIEHTTRDVVNEYMDYKDDTFCFLDTAGIRRKTPTRVKAKQKDLIMERDSLREGARAIDDADIVFVVIDVFEGLTKQDEALVGDAIDLGKSIMIVANKTDTLDDDQIDACIRAIDGTFRFAQWAPKVMVSAKYGKNVKKLLDKALEVYHERRKKVPDEELLSILKGALSRLKPPRAQGKAIRIADLIQVKINPPIFRLIVSHPQDLSYAYVRYIENQVRKACGFMGTPLKFQLHEYEATRRPR